MPKVLTTLFLRAGTSCIADHAVGAYKRQQIGTKNQECHVRKLHYRSSLLLFSFLRSIPNNVKCKRKTREGARVWLCRRRTEVKRVRLEKVPGHGSRSHTDVPPFVWSTGAHLRTMYIKSEQRRARCTESESMKCQRNFWCSDSFSIRMNEASSLHCSGRLSLWWMAVFCERVAHWCVNLQDCLQRVDRAPTISHFSRRRQCPSARNSFLPSFCGPKGRTHAPWPCSLSLSDMPDSFKINN